MCFLIIARAGPHSKCSCESSSIACSIDAQQSLWEKGPHLVRQEEAATFIHVKIKIRRGICWLQKEILYTARLGVRHNVVSIFFLICLCDKDF